MTSSIEKNVMRRVRTIHTVRPLLSMTSLSAFFLLLAVWGIGREVWVAQVFANMPALTDLPALALFTVSAFTHTEFVVQALVVVVLAAALWLVRDAVRSLGFAVRTA